MFSPDGKMIACGWEDGSVQRWNIDGKMMKGVWMGHSSRVNSLSWSLNGGQAGPLMEQFWSEKQKTEESRPTVILGSLSQLWLTIYILALISSHWQVIRRRVLIIYGQWQAQNSIRTERLALLTFSHRHSVSTP
ncbi:hypothetical protein DEU56DRAFT_178465 [Suillus clintonianus]|uniref:uncharacterized protein n=1 Tax=Suillus clintonianus TaxID=1904413 RepID=UPI001B87AAAA|nr:uncharacterized protein DEU56DRAFT_178465 [Suillus clintonianus]KAG2115033.1 hypothetical protein DEU56DRAFT_178465 [Suillus clintonianus]